MVSTKSLGLPVGIRGKRGFPTTKRAVTKKPPHASKRVKFVRELVDEICGFSPYETRILDLLELNEKRAQRFAKKRLGSLQTAKKKLRKLEDVKRKLKRREQELRAEYDAKFKKPTSSEQ